MLVNLLVWIIFGALAGWIASLVMRTDDEQGSLANIVIGIFGAIIGGFIVQVFGGDGITGFNPYSLLIAVFGAVLLLAVLRRVSHRY